MGWGDEIMASGRARKAQESNPYPVVILDRHGKPRWHEAWRGNPRILHPSAIKCPHQVITDGPRARPYVDTTEPLRWKFRAGRCERGEIYLDAKERAMAPAGEYVLVQPHTKPGQPNKAWGWGNWAGLAALLPWPLVQAGPKDWPGLPGVRRVETQTFRQAAGVIAGARMVIVPEGAMHHAAAALGVPAVVLYGGFITPEITGYPDQCAIVDEGPQTPCGVVKTPCAHCTAAWARITPDQVAAAAIEYWGTLDARRTAAA